MGRRDQESILPSFYQPPSSSPIEPYIALLFILPQLVDMVFSAQALFTVPQPLRLMKYSKDVSETPALLLAWCIVALEAKSAPSLQLTLRELKSNFVVGSYGDINQVLGCCQRVLLLIAGTLAAEAGAPGVIQLLGPRWMFELLAVNLLMAQLSLALLQTRGRAASFAKDSSDFVKTYNQFEWPLEVGGVWAAILKTLSHLLYVAGRTHYAIYKVAGLIDVAVEWKVMIQLLNLYPVASTATQQNWVCQLIQPNSILPCDTQAEMMTTRCPPAVPAPLRAEPVMMMQILLLVNQPLDHSVSAIIWLAWVKNITEVAAPPIHVGLVAQPGSTTNWAELLKQPGCLFPSDKRFPVRQSQNVPHKTPTL